MHLIVNWKGKGMHLIVNWKEKGMHLIVNREGEGHAFDCRQGRRGACI